MRWDEIKIWRHWDMIVTSMRYSIDFCEVFQWPQSGKHTNVRTTPGQYCCAGWHWYLIHSPFLTLILRYRSDVSDVSYWRQWGVTVTSENHCSDLKEVGCLTSLQHASVFRERICLSYCMCCHTETGVADQTFYLAQSQCADTRTTSPRVWPNNTRHLAG